MNGDAEYEESFTMAVEGERMAMTIEAVYEDGALRPAKPLDLPEGCHVELIVLLNEATNPGMIAHSSRVRIMREIAALPMEGDEESFSGRDHDRILYGDSDEH
jgi:predicted DNA-binding antitoxin AbrB/MazE fold protein